MIHIEITSNPIRIEDFNNSHREDGAEIVFRGRVRQQEGSDLIIALEYEQYEGMTEKELNKLASETCDRFAIHDLICTHRIGPVLVGEASLQVVLWSKHRQEGLAAMDWFIAELKIRVPIWKWKILKDGNKIPVD